jgi:hypothetical protein
MTQSVIVVHSRSDVAVAAVDTNWSPRHTVRSAHVRSLDAVGAAVSNCETEHLEMPVH